MTARGIHSPGDFLASPTELPVAGAPSPVAFRRWAKRQLFERYPGGLDLAWRIDWEVDRLIPARLLHLMWALGVQVQAAAETGLVAQARGWCAGLTLAAAMRLADHDPVDLGLSGADGLTDLATQRGSRVRLAVPPGDVGEAAAGFLEWGRRRRRRFTVALVAPGAKLLPFDWDSVRELAVAPTGEHRELALAWVPDERAVQIPWGETADGYPVALLPGPHLRSSGVHLVTLEPEPLLAAAARRRPRDAAERTTLARRVLAGNDSSAFDRLAAGWMPPALADERPLLASLLAEERPSTLRELVTLVALADDELRREYFLERFRGRRGCTEPAEGLPGSAADLLAPTRGLIVFTEQIGALVARYAGWHSERAFQFACELGEGSGRHTLALVADRMVQRGLSAGEAEHLRLAIERWAPLCLGMRDAAPRASLVYELALTSR